MAQNKDLVADAQTLLDFILNISFFILNFLITVAPSTKSGCFSGGRGKNLITMLIKQINKEKEHLQC